MAMLIKADGSIKKVRPENGRNFHVKEIERLIGGKCDMHSLGNRNKLFINIQQGSCALEFNCDASDLLNAPVVGDAIVLSDDEFSLS